MCMTWCIYPEPFRIIGILTLSHCLLFVALWHHPSHLLTHVSIGIITSGFDHHEL